MPKRLTPEQIEAAPDAQEEPESWPEPTPFPEGLPAVDRFDYALLPERLRPWAEDICDRVRCPRAGCEFAVAQKLLACVPVEGNRFIRAQCSQKNACGPVAAHGRACA